MKYDHYDEKSCENPLWCYSGNIDNGVAARVWDQECFPGLSGTYKIEAVNYVIAKVLSNPKNPEIEIYEYSGGEPAEDPLFVVALKQENVSMGTHTYDVSGEGLVVEAPFCVGLAGGEMSNESSLGVAVDSFDPMAARSFVKVAGSGECKVLSFEDVTVLQPVPLGRWCIGFDATKLD